MILDTLENFGKYVSLNPLFPKVLEYLQNTDLMAQEPGCVNIDGNKLFVNHNVAKGKTVDQARMETHNAMIDIQIPVSGDEEHGWCPAELLPQAEYDEAADMSLYDPVAPGSNPSLATTYFTLRRGQFAIYFPSDGHAPAVTPTGLRKAIFKVKA